MRNKIHAFAGGHEATGKSNIDKTALSFTVVYKPSLQNSKNENYAIVQYNESHAHCASLHIYIIQSSDINVKAFGCDSLYRTITKFSFLLF